VLEASISASGDANLRASISGIMNFTGFQACGTGNAKILAVFLHGFRRTGAAMIDLKRTTLEVFGGKVDSYAPSLPYSNRLDWTGANCIVEMLVARQRTL
jgi:hypothetical protein